MVAILYQNDLHIISGDLIGYPQRHLPGHILVSLAMEKPDGAMKLDRSAQQ